MTGLDPNMVLQRGYAGSAYDTFRNWAPPTLRAGARVRPTTVAAETLIAAWRDVLSGVIALPTIAGRAVGAIARTVTTNAQRLRLRLPEPTPPRRTSR